jgi:hypothetical protein
MTKYRILDSWFEAHDSGELDYVALIQRGDSGDPKEVRLGKNWLGIKTPKETLELFAANVREAFAQ